jgi:hypothetical protein
LVPPVSSRCQEVLSSRNVDGAGSGDGAGFFPKGTTVRGIPNCRARIFAVVKNSSPLSSGTLSEISIRAVSESLGLSEVITGEAKATQIEVKERSLIKGRIIRALLR